MKLRTCGSFRTYRDFILSQSWKENCTFIGEKMWWSLKKIQTTFQRDWDVHVFGPRTKALNFKSKNLAWKVHCLGKKWWVSGFREWETSWSYRCLWWGWNEMKPSLIPCCSRVPPPKAGALHFVGALRVKFWGNKFGCEDGKMWGGPCFVDQNLESGPRHQLWVGWKNSTYRGEISPQLPIYFWPFIGVLTPFIKIEVWSAWGMWWIFPLKIKGGVLIEGLGHAVTTTCLKNNWIASTWGHIW